MRRILGITYTHENNVLSCGTQDYCKIFGECGYATDIINAARTEDIEKLDKYLRSGEVAFCFGLQGVGSNLQSDGLVLWERMKVPFIGLHYDNPCYNIYNHRNDSLYVANIYFSEYFFDVRQRYLPNAQLNMVLPYRMTGYIHDPDIAYKDRPVKLCFFKSGGDLSEYEEYIRKLPPTLQEGVRDLLLQAQKDPDLHLYDLVNALFVANGYDRETYSSQFWAVMQCVDYYLRRKRAILFVEWIKKQEGAVIVGDGWDFIDKSDARAIFKDSVPVQEAYRMTDQAKINCNVTPYGRDLVHERVTTGLARFCCVISDRNAWFDKNCSGIPALRLFSWAEPLDDQLEPWLRADTDLEKLSLSARDAALKRFWSHDNIHKIISFAQEVRAYASAHVKPRASLA